MPSSRRTHLVGGVAALLMLAGCGSPPASTPPNAASPAQPAERSVQQYVGQTTTIQQGDVVVTYQWDGREWVVINSSPVGIYGGYGGYVDRDRDRFRDRDRDRDRIRERDRDRDRDRDNRRGGGGGGRPGGMPGGGGGGGRPGGMPGGGR